MSIINIKNHALVKYGKEFSDLSRQVIKGTPINCVAITRIYDNETRSYLMSDPAMGEMLLTKKHRFIRNVGEVASLLKQSHHLWRFSDAGSVDKKTRELFEDCIALNYGNGITLVERGVDSVQLNHFLADGGYESINSYLQHHVDRLWNHVIHIRQLLNESDELKSAFNSRYAFKMDDQPSENIIHSTNIEHLDQYDLGGFFDGIKFTYREMQCLCLMQKETSAKKVARQLGISYRSVEAMIYRILNKTNINNKTELLLKLSSNNAFIALQSIL